MKNTIRVERAKKRITQAELAKELNLSRQTIHAIENGKFDPKLSTAAKICRYFSLKIHEVFNY